MKYICLYLSIHFSILSLSFWPRVSSIHRHLKIIDCLTAHVFFISTVNGLSKKRKEAYFALR